MSSVDDDVRLPFSTLDPMIGDVFTALWEPEMMAEMGNALKILTTEVLSTVGQTVLQATVMTALVSALQWPLSSFSLFLSSFPSIIRSDLAFLSIPFSPHEAQLPHRQVSSPSIAPFSLELRSDLRRVSLFFPALGQTLSTDPKQQVSSSPTLSSTDTSESVPSPSSVSPSELEQSTTLSSNSLEPKPTESFRTFISSEEP